MVLFPLLVSSQTLNKAKDIPDYSTKDRKDIPIEFTWKIDDIYKTKEAWNADKEKLTQIVNKVVESSKNWTSSASNILAMFKLRDSINLIGTKLYSYASHQYNADIGNTIYQSMTGELRSIFVQLSTKFAFMNPDIITLGADKFKTYLKEEPKLLVYKFGVEDIL